MDYGDIGLSLQGSSAILATLGAFAGAQGQQIALNGQADVARINAAASERAAQAALLAGQRDEQRSGIATANLKATQQTGFAANGIDLGEGSAARTLTSTDVMGAIDKNTIAANALRGAWGYRVQATNYQNEAITKSSAAEAISPWMAAGSSLINGASKVADTWYTLNKAGALNNGTGDFARMDRNR